MFAFHLDFAGGIFERKGRGMPWEKGLAGFDETGAEAGFREETS
jgi:hypothetical protein